MGAPPYSDDDLVYVDPESRTVVGRVEWGKDGAPKPMPYGTVENGKERGGRTRHPWGTYRSMKRAFQLEGKTKGENGNATLDEALPRALDDSV